MTESEKSPATGKVYLVGAGPGDPGLITVRGRDLIRRADVILYDALINTELLELAPGHCEKIYVGKRPGGNSITQRTINNEIIRHAKAGRRVVRLKGGDPYIYGRGGEEAMACRAAGVPVEVVPGITSAIAVPAYAGIPLLQRNLAGSVLFLHGRFKARAAEHETPPETADEGTEQAGERGPEKRGGVIIRRHRRKGAELKVKSESVEVEQDHHDPSDDMGHAQEVDWEAVAKAADTIVVLMTMGSLDELRDGLLAGGRSPEQPVAAIQWGTTPYQKTVISTVQKFPDDIRGAGVGSPAVIVIGEVVNIQGELDSYERRPLFGWRIAVVESGDAGRDIAEGVFEEGGRPVVFECAKPPSLAGSAEEFEGLQEDFQNATHIVFLSGPVVPLFEQAAKGSKFDAHPFLSTLKVLAVEEEGLAELRERGYPAELLSGGPSDNKFLKVWGGSPKDTNAIVVEAEDEWSDLPDELEDAGARVLTLPISEYAANENEIRRLGALLERRESQAIVFATPWAASAVVATWREHTSRYLENVVVIVATAEIAEILTRAGVDVHLVTGTAEPIQLVERISAWRTENRSQEQPVAAPAAKE